MAQALKNRAGEYSSTTGTGTYSFSGTKVAGHQLFVTAFANTNTIECCVVMGDDFEIGTYTFATGSPNTLARTSVRASTNSNNAVNWGAGDKEITQVVPADRIGYVLDGTVAAPAVSFYEDPDNGIYRTGANAWSLGCAGAQAIGVAATVINIPYTTASTSTTTGALVVAGGVAVGGALNVGGALVITGALSGVTTLAMNNKITISSIVADTSFNFMSVGGSGIGFVYEDIANTSGALRFGVEGSSGGNLFIGDTAYASVIGSSTAKSLEFGTSATIRMAISSAGAVRMHIYGAGAATFDASGNITSVSDARMKNETRKFTRGLADLLAMDDPVYFKWRPESGMETEHEYVNYTAQGAMKGIPEAGSLGPDGLYSYSDRPLLAAAVNAIKELKVKIDELHTRVM